MTAIAVSRTTRAADVLATREAVVHQFPVPEPAAATQHILAVTFRSADGRRWRAVGGGETVLAAIDWARECCPDDAVWEAETWNDLYGE